MKKITLCCDKCDQIISGHAIQMDRFWLSADWMYQDPDRTGNWEEYGDLLNDDKNEYINFQFCSINCLSDWISNIVCNKSNKRN